MKLVLISVLSMVGLGAFFALVLAIVDRKMKVIEDVRISKIAEALPGANCGACGVTSCHAFAEIAVAKGEGINCPLGGEEASQKIAAILGIEHTVAQKKIAVVHCGVKESQRKKRAKYLGIVTCQAVELLNGGDMECGFGCLGYGDCVKACPFCAIEIKEGKVEVSVAKCTACGKCVEACPRKIISLEVLDKDRGVLLVACNSKDNGAVVKKICVVGCIGCGICVKLTPGGAFELKENLARVNYGKLTQGEDGHTAIEKCPTKCIKEVR